MYYGMIG